MKIELETNGRGDETQITINGKVQTNLTFFEFSVNTDRSNKCKMTMMQCINGEFQPVSYFADDFRKFDEATRLNSKEEINVIGGKK